MRARGSFGFGAVSLSERYAADMFFADLLGPRTGGPRLHEAEDDSSLAPGESVLVDGKLLRTYADAVSWYAIRAEVLRQHQRAFEEARYQVPDGVIDLADAAEARIRMMRRRGTEPISDTHMESLLGWLEVYVDALRASDSKMEVIAVDRFRATRRELERIEKQAEALRPQLQDAQRAAFRAGSKSKLENIVNTFATILNSSMVAEQWVREAATHLDDIKVLGTTLRTQKALHGSKTPWHELMRSTTNSKVAKLLKIAKGLDKVLAGWQLFDASLTLVAGGKTASDRSRAAIGLSTTLASTAGTFLGASAVFTLYTNLYLSPMVGRILGQIDQLENMISVGRNRPYMQLNELDMVTWSIEPGGREMFEYMLKVMRARSATSLPSIPSGVGKYFSKHKGDFEAGIQPRSGIPKAYGDHSDKRTWVFGHRKDIWAMLYGSMSVP